VWLAVVAVVATGGLVYLLTLSDPAPGLLVIISGLGGIIGASISPLMERRPEEHLEELTKAHVRTRVLTVLLVNIVGGFGLAAVAFVVTGSLLMTEPTTNALGTAAFGGIVGYYAGREINRMRLGRTTDEAAQGPAVAAVLGELEDQLLGRPLANYDGYAVARWEAASNLPEAVGWLIVHMVARKAREQEGFVDDTSPENPWDSELPARSKEARVLIQGGTDADLVPFAVSVISGTFDVQPQRRILAAPSEGTSEELRFTLLDPRMPEEGPRTDESRSENRNLERETTAVLVDVSQAGRTIQLFEVEIPPTWS
jgi:hypothetical protein